MRSQSKVDTAPTVGAQDVSELGVPDHLQAVALAIPDMGAHRHADLFRQSAARVQAGQAIVEVGAWLGASTAHLALGTLAGGKNVPIHVFDRWRVNADQVEKARRFGLDLAVGQDSLPLFEHYLAPFGVAVVPHQGEFADTEWHGGPIGLYVDDGAKDSIAFHRMLTVFAPHWVPGATRLILNDFYFFERTGKDDHRYQQRVVETFPACFEVVIDRPSGTGSIVLDYRERLPLADLPAATPPAKRQRPLVERVALSVKKRLGFAADRGTRISAP